MFRRCVHFASWSNFYLIFLVSIEPKSCGSTYCFLSHPCLFDAMESYFLVLHSWSPRRWTSLHYLFKIFFHLKLLSAMQCKHLASNRWMKMKWKQRKKVLKQLTYLTCTQRSKTVIKLAFKNSGCLFFTL